MALKCTIFKLDVWIRNRRMDGWIAALLISFPHWVDDKAKIILLKIPTN